MAEKVLLVDDEADFLEVLSERMEQRGMNVSTTTSAKDALKKVEDESFDAVVLDLMMPEMDGIEALQALLKKKPDLQVILLTGQASLDKGIKAMKLGALDFLEKPVDIQTLQAKIKEAQSNKMVLVEKQTSERIKKILTEKAW
ncbi:MAG: response regulator [Deltaproteobacteria bacterium]|nr:response regulator [Deltaproteobacteria bacterium]